MLTAQVSRVVVVTCALFVVAMQFFSFFYKAGTTIDESQYILIENDRLLSGGLGDALSREMESPATNQGGGHNCEEKKLATLTEKDEFPIFHSSLRFLFFVGLEGTGHHMLKGLVAQSPAVDRLRGLKIHHEWTTKLQDSLHNQKSKNGLFNVHCETDEKKTNTAKVFQTTVDTMIEMRKIAEQGKDLQPEKPRHKDDEGYTKPLEHIAMPVNTLQALSGGSGEMSYPNFHGDCRKLNYPSLDLFYAACKQAQVDCQHVYIYRDPYAILRSTTVKRDFNQHNRVGAMHLYATMLKVLQAQLVDYPAHVAGCFGLLDEPDGNWWETARELFGWKNQTSFDAHVKAKMYKPHKSITKEQKVEMVPPHLQLYMDAWVKAHEGVIRLCNKLMEENSQR